jgi:hypothetical protein
MAWGRGLPRTGSRSAPTTSVGIGRNPRGRNRVRLAERSLRNPAAVAAAAAILLLFGLLALLRLPIQSAWGSFGGTAGFILPTPRHPTNGAGTARGDHGRLSRHAGVRATRIAAQRRRQQLARAAPQLPGGATSSRSWTRHGSRWTEVPRAIPGTYPQAFPGLESNQPELRLVPDDCRIEPRAVADRGGGVDSRDDRRCSARCAEACS